MSADSTSPFKMIEYQAEVAETIRKDPNVANVVSIAGIPSSNQSLFFVRLKPYHERKADASSHQRPASESP